MSTNEIGTAVLAVPVPNYSTLSSELTRDPRLCLRFDERP